MDRYDSPIFAIRLRISNRECAINIPNMSLRMSDMQISNRERIAFFSYELFQAIGALKWPNYVNESAPERSR
jgi:hypothetical protein